MGQSIFIDQTGYKVEVPETPLRIVSLVPSQTELLFYLGLENRVVGITKFCIHPRKQVTCTPKIGGTKQFNFDKIDQLKPDLIIANKEENYKEGIEQLRNKYPVWTSDIFDINDSVQMIQELGKLTRTEFIAADLCDSISEKWVGIKDIYAKSVLYFIWQKPYMVAAKNTFIDSVLQHLGFNNSAAFEERYPELSNAKMNELNPEIVFLSSEPYPFNEKHIKAFQEIFPDAEIVLVDGEMFSWYGNRLLEAIDYFKELKV